MAATQQMARPRTIPALANVRDWRMGTKMLVAFLALAIVPLLITGIVSVTISRNALVSQGDINVTGTAGQLSDGLNTLLDDQAAYIRMLGQMSDYSAYLSFPNDPVAQSGALKALVAASTRKYYDSIALMDNQGTILLSSAEGDIGSKLPYRDYFQQAMKGEVYISDPSVSTITNRPAIFFSSPVRDAVGDIVGVIRSRVNLDMLWDEIEADKDIVGPGSFSLLLDENGIRLATSLSKDNRAAIENSLLYRSVAPLSEQVKASIISDKRFGTQTEQRMQVLPLPEIAAAMKNPGQSFDTAADNSTARFHAAIVKMTAKPWYVLVLAPTSLFNQAADTIGTTFIALTVIVIAIAILAGWSMARGFTRPIVELTQVADRISLGELDAKITIQRKDEIGDLAQSVRRMQASLQAAIERLRARRAG